MRNARANPFPSVIKNDLFRVRRILELAFNNDTQTAKLEQHVGAVLPVDADCLGVRRDAEFRD